MADDDGERFTAYLKANVERITDSDVFCSLYSGGMADFVNDPGPAVQLAIAILLDKPIIVACLPGRTPPAKLLALADAVVYGDETALALGIKEAMERLVKDG